VFVIGVLGVVLVFSGGGFGVLIGVLLLLVAGGMVLAPSANAQTEADQTGQRSFGPDDPSVPPPTPRLGHEPPRPQGAECPPWSPLLRELEVAGEYYRIDSISGIFTSHDTTAPNGAELHHQAALVPDGSNPYDDHAVAVFVAGVHVGHLERAQAQRYFAPIQTLSNRGHQLVVSSRQWARNRGRGEPMAARVTVSLPEPEGITPANQLPPDAFVWPLGSAVQVTGEAQYMNAIRPFLRPDGAPVSLAVTLHATTKQRARSVLEVLEARVDGQLVGTLSPQQCRTYVDMVRHITDHGRTPTARAVLKGNSIKAEITLHIAKPHDIAEAQLAGLAE
jgi:collagen type III alpha